MAYDQGLAQRLIEALATHSLPEVEEKKMFGGFVLMVRGNLCCGVHKNDLLVRVQPDREAQLLKKPGARPFAITGHAMKGWILVQPEHVTEDPALATWLVPAVDHVMALPPKPKKSPQPAAVAKKRTPRA